MNALEYRNNMMFPYLANGGTVGAPGKTYEYMKERFAK